MNVKLGTELNVALDTDHELREKSYQLNVGYDDIGDTWQLIIRYIGDLQDIVAQYNLIATELLAGFAIIEANRALIYDIANDQRIIYIEKPKGFIQSRIINGFVSSCMSVPYFEMNLRGKGITVAVLDSGIDIYHSDFIDVSESEDSNMLSKIIGIWDQNIIGNPPAGYSIGTFFDGEDINRAINDPSREFPSIDVSGHGTAVAGIIATCTPSSELLVVKLNTRENEETDTINLMLAIDFAVRYSINNNSPLVINLSYGNNSGDHAGNSVLEQYIDIISGMSRLTIVVGAGNDALSGRHVQINMGNDTFYKRDFQVSDGEGGISIQIWRTPQDQVDIFLTTPTGEMIGPFNDYTKLMVYNVNRMNIRVLNNGPTPINIYQETYISIIPLDDYIEAGIWSLRFNPKSIINGRVDAWLPVEGSTNTDIFFLTPSKNTTITIPSSAKQVIAVGAYDSNSLTYAPFSGRGYTVLGIVKPDIVAPGVNIDVPKVGGGYTLVSGTSFAAPFVSAAASMLMEYGIINGVDPFLYGEKVKAYIIAGAFDIAGYENIPNPVTGWGGLCVENSIPI